LLIHKHIDTLKDVAKLKIIVRYSCRNTVRCLNYTIFSVLAHDARCVCTTSIPSWQGDRCRSPVHPLGRSRLPLVPAEHCNQARAEVAISRHRAFSSPANGVVRSITTWGASALPQDPMAKGHLHSPLKPSHQGIRPWRRAKGEVSAPLCNPIEPRAFVPLTTLTKGHIHSPLDPSANSLPIGCGFIEFSGAGSL
jgi:hypothetical protein